MLIQDQSALERFCADLSGAPWLAVDTEFLRERTYRATLCLVQVAYGGRAAAIDPLAPGIDLAPLFALLDDERKLKVLHSAEQDLDVFYSLRERLPRPIFDTQVAASVLGFGEQPGYAAVVGKVMGIQIDKASQVTDWSYRPLTRRQVDYALSDVVHLCGVYEWMEKRLRELGRRDWIEEEIADLLKEEHYAIDPRRAFERIRMRRPDRRTLAVLRELCAWRETAAGERNLPRNWVVKDEALIEIASHRPKRIDDLKRVRALTDRTAASDGAALLRCVAEGMAVAPDDCPPLPIAEEATAESETLVALLQAMLRLRCESNGVAQRLVANRRDLERIATEADPDVKALRGWRRELFGDDALRLKRGEVALTGDGREAQVVRLDDR